MAQLARVSLLLAAFVVALAPTVQAQDYLRMNGWYEVNFVKFKPDRAQRAFEIVHNHFQEVDKKVERQVLPFDFKTGEWDHIVYFPIALNEEGYDTVPPRSEWWAAFVEQEGGEEQADKLFAEFLDSVAQSRTEIARLVLGSQTGR